jgi:insulysin
MIFLVLCVSVAEILLPVTNQDTFKVIQLKNSFKCTLVSCEACSEAGVSLGVKVGSAYDTVPGIAHFLEHMVFFSSKTYPEEDYLTTYIDTNGGYINAFTEYGDTVYYYSISNSGLKHSLHIFSRLFVEPLFLEDTANREIKAVNSEQEGDKYEDGWRIQKLFEILAGKPLDHSTIGNLETLSLPNITDELYSFWDKYYNAENMRLAVYGNFSIEELERWVIQMFSDLKNGNSIPVFETGSGKGNYAIGKKITPGNIILMNWKIKQQDYEYQTSNFLGYLLNYALESTLENLYPGSGFYSGSYVDLNIYTMFVIEGVFYDSTIDSSVVCGQFLAAIESLKKLSNQTLFELWEDYKLLSFYEFYYSDPVEGADLASTIAYNMLYLPEELYVAGYSIKLKYSFEKIQETLLELSPERAFTSILTEKPSVNLTLYDSGFDLWYYVSNWTIKPSDLDFNHLKLNPYLPKNLDIIKKNYTTDLILHTNNTHRIWFKYDYSVKKPIVIISALIFLPDWQSNKLLALIHVAIVNQMASFGLRYYNLAGYTYEILLESAGISIKVEGWNEGILNYFGEVLRLYTNPDISKYYSTYYSIKNNLIKKIDQEPYLRAIDYLSRLISSSYLSNQDQYEILMATNYTDYLYFSYLVKYCSIDLIVLGNLDPPDSLYNLLLEFFVPVKAEKSYKHSLGVVGYNFFVASNASQNAILNWYEFGPYDSKTYSAVMLLEIINNDQAFIVLRSQAQLGYTVLMKYYDGFMTNAIYLIVQGSYYNPLEMQSYITDFWNNVNFTESSIEKLKKTMKTLLVDSKNFADMFQEIWFEILIGRLEFDHKKKILDNIEKVEFEDIVDLLKQIQRHANELSIRIYKDISQSTETSISLDYYRDISINYNI